MRRDDTIQFRISSAEKAELIRRAKLQGITVTELIRQKLDLDASKRRP